MNSPIDGGAVLITGASSGIGREIARQVAGRAKALVLVARRQQRLLELQRELLEKHPRAQSHVAVCDLGDPASLETMVSEAERAVGPIDVVVNNAGFGVEGLFEQSEWQRLDGMIQLNVVAVAWLTHRLLPSMLRRGGGGFLNVGSGAGVAAMAGSALYSATKHFLHGLSESLRFELAGTGVRVTEVCPGPVTTEFDQVAGLHGMAGGPPQSLRITAAQCATEAIDGFDRDRPVTYPGGVYRTLMRIRPLVPMAAQRRVAEKVGRKLRAGPQ
jgi:short-subunit dehydrogenase